MYKFIFSWFLKVMSSRGLVPILAVEYRDFSGLFIGEFSFPPECVLGASIKMWLAVSVLAYWWVFHPALLILTFILMTTMMFWLLLLCSIFWSQVVWTVLPFCLFVLKTSWGCSGLLWIWRTRHQTDFSLLWKRGSRRISGLFTQIFEVANILILLILKAKTW